MKELILRKATHGKTGLKAFQEDGDINRVKIKKYSASGNLRGVGTRKGTVNLGSGAQITSVDLTDDEIKRIQKHF